MRSDAFQRQVVSSKYEKPRKVVKVSREVKELTGEAGESRRRRIGDMGTRLGLTPGSEMDPVYAAQASG
jgi:hypothetical protein